jgi:hypothetical protein
MSDQDVLTALLASSEHAQIPLFLLRSGKDIAQCFEEDGYTVQDRLINFFFQRVPQLVHAQGGKPWKNGVRASYQQLSTYSPIALPYAKQWSLPRKWAHPDNFLFRLVNIVTFNEPNLRGIFPASFRTLQRCWKHRNEIVNYLKRGKL